MDITPISGLPLGRPLSAAEADRSVLAERVLLMADAEHAELARLRSNEAVYQRVLSDAASVLQHAHDCVESAHSRSRCERQRDACWAALALIRQGRG